MSTPSHFDPEYSVRKGRTAFLRRFVREISQPVMPDDEALEYLPTQVVAEYLSQKAEPRFDGIIYPSSQMGGSGENVVFFNHSSRVEPYALPEGSTVKVDIPIKNQLDEDDDFYDGIWVSETVPSIPAEEPPIIGNGPAQTSSLGWFWEHLLEDPEDDREPNIKLDMSSVVILDIKGVAYSSNGVSVTRHRQTQEESDAFMQHLVDVGLGTLLDVGVQEKPGATP